MLNAAAWPSDVAWVEKVRHGALGDIVGRKKGYLIESVITIVTKTSALTEQLQML